MNRQSTKMKELDNLKKVKLEEDLLDAIKCEISNRKHNFNLIQTCLILLPVLILSSFSILNYAIENQQDESSNYLRTASETTISYE
jgi:hypothetical protein